MDTLSVLPPLPLSPVRTAADAKSLDAAARDFEAMLATQLFEHMFAGVATDGMFGGGFAEETFRTFLLDAFGRSLAEGQGLGLAADIRASLAASSYAAGKEI